MLSILLEYNLSSSTIASTVVATLKNILLQGQLLRVAYTSRSKNIREEHLPPKMKHNALVLLCYVITDIFAAPSIGINKWIRNKYLSVKVLIMINIIIFMISKKWWYFMSFYEYFLYFSFLYEILKFSEVSVNCNNLLLFTKRFINDLFIEINFFME